VPLEIDLKKYQKEEEQVFKWSQEDGEEKGKALKGVTKLEYLKRTAANLKMKGVLDWVDNFLEETGKKIALFGWNVEILDILEKHYKGICVRVDGSVNPKKRQDLKEIFQTKDKIKVFIGNWEAAGTSITLTAADTLGLVQIPWCPGAMFQVEDRIHRISLKSDTVNIYYFVAKGTIEEDMMAIVTEKDVIDKAVIDGNKVESSLQNLIIKQLWKSLGEKDEQGQEFKK
jgi:SNF2 family DNA or RNA helicase